MLTGISKASYLLLLLTMFCMRYCTSALRFPCSRGVVRTYKGHGIISNTMLSRVKNYGASAPLYPRLLVRVQAFSTERENNEKGKPRVENNFNIPNFISMTRIIASPGLAVAICYDMKEIAFAGCIAAAITDWLDGYIAKKYNLQTQFGAFIDPLGDKFVIGALTVGLTMQNLIPVGLASLILGRDIFLIGCNFLIRALEKPPGAPFFDLSTATYKVTPTDLSKFNTAMQFLLLGATLGHFSFGYPSMSAIEPFHWITAVTTLSSGVGYLGGAGVTKIDLPPEYQLKSSDDSTDSKP